MDIFRRWQDLTLDRLVPSEGKDHLGLVVAFPFRSRLNSADAESVESIYKNFIYGAVDEGYRVLLVNSSEFSDHNMPSQPMIVVGDHKSLHSVYIPGSSYPMGPHLEKPLIDAIRGFSQQYDIIVVSTFWQRNGGGLDLKDAESNSHELTDLVDRFFFPTYANVPNHLKDRSVSYIFDDPKYRGPKNSLPVITEISNNLAEIVHVKKHGYTNLNVRDGDHVVRHGTWETPVAVAVHESGRSARLYRSASRVVFGALVGLTPKSLTHAKFEIYEYYEKSSDAKAVIARWIGAAVTIGIGAVGIVASRFFDLSQKIEGVNGLNDSENPLASRIWVAVFVVIGALVISVPISAHIGRGLYGSKRHFAKIFKKQTPARKSLVTPMATLKPRFTTVDAQSIPLPDELVAENYRYTTKLTGHATQSIPAALSLSAMHERAVHSYNQVRERWVEYELDILKFLDAPLMRDMTSDLTAKFFVSMHQATDVLRSIDSSYGDLRESAVREFKECVVDMRVAFEKAEAYAIQQGSDFLEPAKQKDFQTASRMLMIAHDPSASISERHSAFTQGRKMLDRTVATPKTLYGVIEGKINILESSFAY